MENLLQKEIQPKMNPHFTDRQLAIYEQLKGQTIKIVKVHKPGKKATSQISQKTGDKTFWFEYQRVSNGKLHSDHKFLSAHDLGIYFGIQIKTKVTRKVQL